MGCSSISNGGTSHIVSTTMGLAEEMLQLTCDKLLDKLSSL